MLQSRSAERKALWQIHACVLLWGFTAILGKLIALPAMALVIWRVGIVAATLAIVPRVWRELRALGARNVALFAAISCVIALHWLAFFAAIKIANASVAVACLALSTIFAAIIEPALTGRRHQTDELLLGVLALPGVWLLVGGVPIAMQTGVLIGTVAAFLTALFATLNKRYVTRGDPAAITFVQMTSSGLFLALVGSMTLGVDATLQPPSLSDFGWLLLLSLLCTLLPFLLFLRALRHITAFTTQLALNLEPVYAIVIAALLFREYAELTPRFYLGVALILGVVFAQPYLQRRLRHTTADSPRG
ncbi:MAG: DMT family transporter [Sinobacteraceae bacterium]|nr:DMT family transporter [Nevskiaceae bacterium]